VDMVWAQGRLVKATIRAPGGGSCRVRIGSTVRDVQVAPGRPTLVTP
jgi:hypothetical protein